MVFNGHRNAILELHFTQDGDRIITCSADSTVRAWDAQTGEAMRNIKCSEIVNSCCPQRFNSDILVCGLDNGCLTIWDLRVNGPVQTIQGQYPVTAVVFAQEDNAVYSGGVDNCIKACDLRNKRILYTLYGHTDTITGLKVSPNGGYLLSNSMDNSLNLWDLQRQLDKKRLVKTFTGHSHNNEKDLPKCDWSPDGLEVAVGSGDHLIYVWDVASRQLTYKLPGHTGAVLEVVFHPTEPLIGSCSVDKNIFLGELTT